MLTQHGRGREKLGNTHQAIEALEAVLALDKDAPDPDATARLGTIYLRMHDLDQAVRYLRLAEQSRSTLQNAQATISLATALAMRGQTDDAIDALLAWNQSMNLYQGYEQPQLAVGFALVVFYDRDDQRGAAFEILDKMQSAMQNGFGQQIQSALLTLRFEPPEDEAYFNRAAALRVSSATTARRAPPGRPTPRAAVRIAAARSSTSRRSTPSARRTRARTR